ncbi:MAG: succinyl-diaminopimelate desuccinylase [Colwellia sp.]|nr:succinyl-diaminopimelate desuccinylase [Colwellia sp.]
MEQPSTLENTLKENKTLNNSRFFEILKNSTKSGMRAIELTRAMVRFPSITPDDAGCFSYLHSLLEDLHFVIEELTVNGVRNLIAKRVFGQGKRFAFAGHIDVVPAHHPELWCVTPFAADIVDGKLIGRGVVDMKGAIACFIAAVESVNNKLNCGSLYILLTCDEEGEAEFGTKVIMNTLNERHEVLDMCLVGEPTAKYTVADTIKVGRRGAISARVLFTGKEGHVAYPQQAINAVHFAVKFSALLNQLTWDKGTEEIPGTSLQITYIQSSDFSDNIVPSQCEVRFNIRYSYKYSQPDLEHIVARLLTGINCTADIKWERPCIPYHTQGTELIEIISEAVYQESGIRPQLSASGGTSDGRFIANDHTQVVEVGLTNATIHQVNEGVDLDELYTLTRLYENIILKIHTSR